MPQPSNRRLLTEAVGAATYRTAAQVTTEAQAKADAALAAANAVSATKLAAATYTAEKGTANGVATLGSDGKVPAGQLPTPAVGPIVSRLAGAGFYAAVTLASTPATATAVGLQCDGLVAGTYEVVMEGLAVTAGATVRGWLLAANGLVAADSAGSGSVATSAQSSRIGGYWSTSTSGIGGGGSTAWVQSSGGAGPLSLQTGTTFPLAYRYRMLLRVTTGGSLAFRIDNSTTGVASGLDAGSYLSATKVA